MDRLRPIARRTINASAHNFVTAPLLGVELRQPVWCCGHVGIHEGEQLTRGKLHCQISCGVRSQLFWMVVAFRPRVRRGNGTHGINARRAVNQDQLKGTVRLARQRFEASGQSGRGLVTRDYYGELEHVMQSIIMNWPQQESEAPQLSVVVTIGERRWRAWRCLKAIRQQRGLRDIQIIVMDSRPDLGSPARAGLTQGLEYHPCPDALSIPHVKALGAQFARADIVAFLEDHCVPEPGWAAAVVNAFAERPNAAAVAYTFENLNPASWASRSFLVLAYGPWMGPVRSGPIPTPSKMNVAYARGILQAESNLAQWFSGEVSALQQLGANGAEFWQAGDARVRHLNHPDLLSGARDSAVWQRLLAATRVEVEAWGWPRRWFYFFAAVPLSPSIIAWRLSRRLWGRPEMRRALVTSLPLIFFVHTYGAFFEAMGYVAGVGDAARRTFDIETSDPRGEPVEG